jgi:hypothetical protein
MQANRLSLEHEKSGSVRRRAADPTAGMPARGGVWPASGGGAALLGHSGLRMVMRYVHPSAESKKEAMQKYERMMRPRLEEGEMMARAASRDFRPVRTTPSSGFRPVFERAFAWPSPFRDFVCDSLISTLNDTTFDMWRRSGMATTIG